MNDKKYLSVSEIAKTFNVSTSTVKRRINALSALDFEANVKKETTGKKSKFFVLADFASDLIGGQSVTGQIERSMNHPVSDKTHTSEIEKLNADLKQARQDYQQLISLMEKQQDQAFTERNELNRRLSEANALQLDLQQQLKTANENLRLLTTKQTEQAVNDVPGNYAQAGLFIGVLFCLLLFAWLLVWAMNY